jgi:hypothetical protein
MTELHLKLIIIVVVYSLNWQFAPELKNKINDKSCFL